MKIPDTKTNNANPQDVEVLLESGLQL